MRPLLHMVCWGQCQCSTPDNRQSKRMTSMFLFKRIVRKGQKPLPPNCPHPPRTFSATSSVKFFSMVGPAALVISSVDTWHVASAGKTFMVYLQKPTSDGGRSESVPSKKTDVSAKTRLGCLDRWVGLESVRSDLFFSTINRVRHEEGGMHGIIHVETNLRGEYAWQILV